MSVISSTQTIITEIASRLGEVSTDNEDQYVTDINQCTRDVALSFPNAPFLRTSATSALTAGTYDYANFSDWEKFYDGVIVSENTKLTYLPADQVDSLAPSASSGVPTIYTVTNGGTAVRYIPTPSAAYTVKWSYHKLLGTVSAVSSTPPLPTKYNELYCLYGEMKGLRRQQRLPEADGIEAKYEALKTRMVDDLNRATTENNQIRSVREFSGGVVDYGDPIKNIYGNNL